MFAESLKRFIDSQNVKQFDFFVLFNPSQVILDLEVLKIDIVLVDMAFDNKTKFLNSHNDNNLNFCKKTFRQFNAYKIIFLVSPNDLNNRQIAQMAKQEELIKDFIFYDSSLKYLISKLATY